uniref:Uncharacterized protein n=1 Tax=Anguilla anguilla TaxID=7936 RepID=A0A0E9Q9E9_ANGAN
MKRREVPVNKRGVDHSNNET